MGNLKVRRTFCKRNTTWIALQPSTLIATTTTTMTTTPFKINYHKINTFYTLNLAIGLIRHHIPILILISIHIYITGLELYTRKIGFKNDIVAAVCLYLLPSVRLGTQLDTRQECFLNTPLNDSCFERRFSCKRLWAIYV